MGLGIADWRTPPLQMVEIKAKGSRSRNTSKLSVYDSVCVSADGRWKIRWEDVGLGS